MSKQRNSSGQAGARPVIALCGLSFLMALGPLRIDLLPNLSTAHELQAAATSAFALAAVAVLAAIFAGFQRSRLPDGVVLLKCGLVGLGLFAAPALARAVPRPVPALTAVALFSLTPVFAAVLEPYLGGPEGLEAASAFPAAIACVAGAFLVFPVAVPHADSAVGFLAAMATAGCAAAANCVGVALLRRPLEEGAPRLSLPVALAVAAGAGALAFAILAVFGASASQNQLRWSALGTAAGWAIACDLPAIFLLFWLMRCMVASLMALRFVIAPMLAVTIEAMALRQHLKVQSWVGVLIAGAASAWMLRGRAQTSPPRDRLLFPGNQ